MVRNDLFLFFMQLLVHSFILKSNSFSLVLQLALEYLWSHIYGSRCFYYQRFKFLRKTNNWYAKGVRKAQKCTANLKKGGESFGMLFHIKYFKEK